MSAHYEDNSDSSGFADLEDFYERTREKASSESSTRPPSPRSRHDDLDVRMEVLMQSPTTDPEQLSIIHRWLHDGLDARQTRGQAQSQSGDRVTYDLSISPRVADNPAAWKQLGSQAPETVRSVRVEFTRPGRRSQSEGAGSLVPRQIEELVKSLNNTKRINDDLTHNGRYSKVSVLPIIRAQKAQECFMAHFNFLVYDIFKIPEKNAQNTLAKKIDELIEEHGKKDELVIVVYAGHGFNPLDIPGGQSGYGPSVWIPRQSSRYTEGVNWSNIQPLLHSAPCDTLIILNCCFAGNAVLGGMKGTNEILAASDRQSVAYAYGRSFLRAVIEVLGELKTSRSSLTINMLRDRLDEYNRNDRDEWRRITSPYHKRYPNLDHPSIKLRALPSSSSSSTSATKRPTTSTQSLYSPSFYVKVSLDSPDTLSLAEWTSCFESANYPSDVKLHFYTEESLRNGFKGDDGE
ncbi:uncharacterized protein Z520_02716 [Fonsecaea multimorphosa CBS 102226]|uniref:Uncharacterized protein n=1 Tax=Fonsecaea multimorphosa CBS 102226 TaxID=1442371 RepID=A0A0D2KWH6_9EURO|nr:uncharacterized protein Z520_02716 [Fonsecaea multimorphosa CBS 102226]KIY01164.1 hypothetical protein Z520_02716 [Fonsecaea multimorphosa CBS 102226]OAL28777.1 hypothetical protein AYO22_02642 [Fonsecaea multimorphosa]